MSGRLALALAAAVVTIAAGRTARADDSPPDKWKVAVGVATDFPIDVAARIGVETPFRLRLSTQLGFLPGPYVSAMNGTLEGFGVYDSQEGDLIKSAIQSSLVWRTHLGYRPFKKLGLYGDVGYGLVTLGGNATTAQLLTAVTGQSLPASEGTGDKAFDAKAALHMLDVEIGYDIPIGDHFEIRTAIGGAFTLASSTTLTPDFTPRSEKAIDAFAAAGETYLNNIFTSYVFTPVLTVGVDYVF